MTSTKATAAMDRLSHTAKLTLPLCPSLGCDVVVCVVVVVAVLLTGVGKDAMPQGSAPGMYVFP